MLSTLLVFVYCHITRAKHKTIASCFFLKTTIVHFYFIPEGGSNKYAVKGCSEILTEAESDYDYIICACGTGTTLAGIISTAPKTVKIIGVSVLKGHFMTDHIASLLNKYFPNPVFTNWEIIENDPLGGYGKYPAPLLDFIKKFNIDYNILLDPIYTGKMMHSIYSLIEKKHFPPNSKVLCIHTGGIQGWGGVI